MRKLYANKEGTGRIKVLVLNESSMPMVDLSGMKINTPRRSLLLNKRKKDSSSSTNNNHAKSNIVASSSSLDSTNDSLSQVTLEQEIAY